METAIYITQDIFLAVLKFKEYKLKKSIYCVGNEQDLYLKQLFKILELLGYSWAKDCYHLSHGMVFLPEGKMKSREGKVVEADDLVLKLKVLASEEILKRGLNIQKTQLSKRSLEIALGALKYYLLQVEPSKNVYFEPQKSISFIGRTGPYVQYAHARICSILRKAKHLPFSRIDYSCLNSKEEKELVMLLAKFPLIVKKSALNYNPAFLSQYLYRLAEKFNLFYENSPVLKANEKTKKTRLLLISCVKIVIAKGLKLLGIAAPEKM
jgi:arginyl-tRNA synthetase